MMKMLAARIGAAAPALARDAAGVTGCVLIAVGAGCIYMPAGLIVGGLMLLAIALLPGRKA